MGRGAGVVGDLGFVVQGVLLCISKILCGTPKP